MAARFYMLNPDIITDDPAQVSRVKGKDGVTVDLDYDGRIPGLGNRTGVHVPDGVVVEVDDTDQRIMAAISMLIISNGTIAWPVLVETSGPADFVLKDFL